MTHKVIKIDGESITFDNDWELYSNHDSSCCESHYLSFSDITLEDFKGLEFDLSENKFFKKIENYGIELIPVKGFSIKVPAYAENNGYYSSNLSLILDKKGKGENFIEDIEDCQIWNE
ncbi:MAG: DUF7448 domain-containing protein [Fusobacteriaceae bacterium]